MNAINQSSNRIPSHTDWQRYDSPTVLRRHGRSFLERTWLSNWSTPLPAYLSEYELIRLVDNYCGQYVNTSDQPLLVFDDIVLDGDPPVFLVFDDVVWARRCEMQLLKRGVKCQCWGCHIQLQGGVS